MTIHWTTDMSVVLSTDRVLLTINEQIFNLSIYINSGRLNNTPFGSRATLYTGNADLKSILHEELSEQYIKRVQEEQRIGAKMLVLGMSS